MKGYIRIAGQPLLLVARCANRCGTRQTPLTYTAPVMAGTQSCSVGRFADLFDLGGDAAAEADLGLRLHARRLGIVRVDVGLLGPGLAARRDQTATGRAGAGAGAAGLAAFERHG